MRRRVFCHVAPLKMNTPLKISALLILGALTAARLSAGFESFKIEPTVKPQYSPVMQMEGVTEGAVIFAVEISADGKLSDCLPIAYTHPALVRPCLEALKEWKITPARLDGQPVAVQAELTVNFKAEGVVISRTSLFDVVQHFREVFGYPFESYPCPADELDGVPTRLATVSPLYSKDAEKDGVRGPVLVHFYIDQNGAVRMPSVKGNVHPYLSDVAVAAVREWRFAPPTSKGKPVLVAAVQEFDFSK